MASTQICGGRFFLAAYNFFQLKRIQWQGLVDTHYTMWYNAVHGHLECQHALKKQNDFRMKSNTCSLTIEINDYGVKSLSTNYYRPLKYFSSFPCSKWTVFAYGENPKRIDTAYFYALLKHKWPKVTLEAIQNPTPHRSLEMK